MSQMKDFIEQPSYLWLRSTMKSTDWTKIRLCNVYVDKETTPISVYLVGPIFVAVSQFRDQFFLIWSRSEVIGLVTDHTTGC